MQNAISVIGPTGMMILGKLKLRRLRMHRNSCYAIKAVIQRTLVKDEVEFHITRKKTILNWKMSIATRKGHWVSHLREIALHIGRLNGELLSIDIEDRGGLFLIQLS